MKLTEHFTLEELTDSEIAERNGIDNTPDQKSLGNLVNTAHSLEEIRDLINRLKNYPKKEIPLIASSAFRCQEVERILKGKPNDWISKSYHTKGLAADIKAHTFGTPYQLAEAIINSSIKFDQLILEFGRWVHVGWSDGKLRNQILTAIYDNGDVVYLPGLRQ